MLPDDTIVQCVTLVADEPVQGVPVNRLNEATMMAIRSPVFHLLSRFSLCNGTGTNSFWLPPLVCLLEHRMSESSMVPAPCPLGA